MPTHLRFKCAFQFYDANPKNTACINPCFRRQMDILDPGSSVDAQQLCSDLADKLAFLPGVGTTPYTVSAYNCEGPKPHYALGIVKRNPAGPIKVPAVVPEVAVCGSFYATDNRPRHRGRIYFPAWLLGAASSDMALVVPSSLRNAITTQFGYWASLGGANVDWGVWSSADHAFYKASNIFVSDAWAVQRSRGIKETARTLATTSG